MRIKTMEQKNYNNKNNEIPYFYNEEELHNFFSSQVNSTQEYLQQIQENEKDYSIFEEKSNKTLDFEFQNKMNKVLGIS